MKQTVSNPAISVFHEIERGDSARQPACPVPPVARLGVVVAFLLTLVSFGKYELAETAAMSIYPAVLVCFERVPVLKDLRRLFLLLIPVALVGAANPFFDRTVVAQFGSFAVTGGWVSFCVLLLKGLLALLAGWSLLRQTGSAGLVQAFGSLRLPPSFGFSFLLLYRYLVMMVKTSGRMHDAYLLRSGSRTAALRPSAWGPFAGLLLMRSVDQATRVQEAILLRGGTGACRPVASSAGSSLAGWIYFLGWGACFSVVRFAHPMQMLGGLFKGGCT